MYVDGIGDVTAADRETLREKWESDPADDDEDDPDDPMAAFGSGWASSDDGFDMPSLGAFADPLAGLYTMNNKEPKVDKFGEPVGITHRLCRVSLAYILFRLVCV